MLTGSDTFFKVIVRPSTITKRWLMIDLAATKELDEKLDIGDMGWISTDNNIAKAFRKQKELNS